MARTRLLISKKKKHKNIALNLRLQSWEPGVGIERFPTASSLVAIGTAGWFGTVGNGLQQQSFSRCKLYSKTKMSVEQCLLVTVASLRPKG